MLAGDSTSARLRLGVSAVVVVLATTACGHGDQNDGVDVPSDGNASSDGDSAAPDADLSCTAPGYLDPSFGNGGIVTSIFGFGPFVGSTSVAVEPATGKILVGGQAPGRDTTAAFALVRLQANGQLDSTFAVDGISLLEIPDHEAWIEDIALQSDGKIVAVGALNTTFTPLEETLSSVILVRYNPDGSLDATFGDGGIVIDQPSPLIHGRGVAIDSSGRILVGAQRWAGFEPGDPSYMALLRYLPDGARDAAFGTAGVAESSFANGRHELHDIAVDAVGRIVSIGRSAPFNGNTDFGIVRHLATGELDGDFGTAGVVTLDFSGGGDDGLAVAIDMADRVVVAGSSDTTAVHGSVARLGIDGQLDDTFGVDGRVMTTASPVKLTSVGVSPADDSILAAGWIAQQSQSIVLARFDSLGTIDPSFGTGGLAVAPPGNLDDLASDLAIQSDRKIIVAATRLESSVPPLSDFLVARYCP